MRYGRRSSNSEGPLPQFDAKLQHGVLPRRAARRDIPRSDIPHWATSGGESVLEPGVVGLLTGPTADPRLDEKTASPTARCGRSG